MSQTTKRTRTRLGRGGRIVIPAEARRELGIEEGDALTLEVRDGELRVYSVLEGIRRIQKTAQKYKRPGESVVDEFIAEKRAEAERE